MLNYFVGHACHSVGDCSGMYVAVVVEYVMRLAYYSKMTRKKGVRVTATSQEMSPLYLKIHDIGATLVCYISGETFYIPAQ